MWYDIDFYKWAVEQLPLRNRKPKMIAFLKTLLASLIQLQTEFLVKRDEDNFLLKHNAQVCYLRKALNDYFDTYERRIYISDGKKYERQYIYTTVEEKPKHIGIMYLRSKDDYADTGVDYIVYVPEEIVNNSELELKALIDKFNVATRRYKIESI